MTQITFLRNAECGNNGHITDYGKSLTEQLNFDVDICICSPLIQTKETLRYSSIKYGKLIYSDLCLPMLDGNSLNYDMDKYNKKLESQDDFYIRVDKLLNTIDDLKKQNYKTILVITHESVLYKITGFYFRHCNFMTMYE